MEAMLTRNPPNMAESKRVNVATRFATAGDGAEREINEHNNAAHATKSSRRPRKMKNAPALCLSPIMEYRTTEYRRTGSARRAATSVTTVAKTYDTGL